MQFFFKQTVQNKCWVTRISLYPCMRLATLQVCLTEKICPWTAVQQEPQRLGKARGFEVLQSVGLAEINLEESEGSACSSSTEPFPFLWTRQWQRQKPNARTHFSVYTVDCRVCRRGWKLSNTFFSKWCDITENFEKRKINRVSFYHPSRSVFIHILHRGTE